MPRQNAASQVRPDHRIVIRGVGMASSLGLDTPTACAAARAGLNRAVALEHFVLKGPDSDVRGIAGHCAPMITQGFEGVARLTRLAQAGLEDLQRSTDGWSTQGAAFYVALPNPIRRFDGLALIEEEALRAEYERELAELRNAHTARSMAVDVLSSATSLAGWPHEFEIRCNDVSGHTGVAVALQAAMADLSNGRARKAIVGGVDSLIGERTLQWLNDTGRLKTPVVAAGLQPGEAAAFLALECEEGAGSAPCLGAIDGLQFALETHPLLEGEPPLGDGLAQVLMASAVTAGWDRDILPWIVSDHNGELYRAYDWGHACTRLRPAYPGLAESAPWHPVEAFGDTGAASGAVGLVMATFAFQRGFAPASSAVVLSSSDGPGRAAVRVSSPLH
jgi:3-oxoacyl-[acyl-carrier-protein] synthase-1